MNLLGYVISTALLLIVLLIIQSDGRTSNRMICPKMFEGNICFCVSKDARGCKSRYIDKGVKYNCVHGPPAESSFTELTAPESWWWILLIIIIIIIIFIALSALFWRNRRRRAIAPSPVSSVSGRFPASSRVGGSRRSSLSRASYGKLSSLRTGSRSRSASPRSTSMGSRTTSIGRSRAPSSSRAPGSSRAPSRAASRLTSRATNRLSSRPSTSVMPSRAKALAKGPYSASAIAKRLSKNPRSGRPSGVF